MCWKIHSPHRSRVTFGIDFNLGEATLKTDIVLGKGGESTGGIRRRFYIAQSGSHGNGAMIRIVCKKLHRISHIVCGVQFETIEVGLYTGNTNPRRIFGLEIGREEEIFLSQEVFDREYGGIRASGAPIVDVSGKIGGVGGTGQDHIRHEILFVLIVCIDALMIAVGANIHFPIYFWGLGCGIGHFFVAGTRGCADKQGCADEEKEKILIHITMSCSEVG